MPAPVVEARQCPALTPADRREERVLVEQYSAMVEELVADFTTQNFPVAIDCASLPDQLRGYGPVKAKATVEYRENAVGLLPCFHNLVSTVQIQEVAGP